jgi:hypothetical protein
MWIVVAIPPPQGFVGFIEEQFSNFIPSTWASQ